MWSNEIAEVELQVFKFIQSYYWQLMSLSIKSKNLNMNQWSGFQDHEKYAEDYSAERSSTWWFETQTHTNESEKRAFFSRKQTLLGWKICLNVYEFYIYDWLIELWQKNYFLSSNYYNSLWKTKFEGNYLFLDVA